MKPNTKLSHLGRTAVNVPATVNVPMHRASTVLFDNVAHLHDTQRRWEQDEQIPTYAIFNMPQSLALENCVAEIEGGARAASRKRSSSASRSSWGTVRETALTRGVYGPLDAGAARKAPAGYFARKPSSPRKPSRSPWKRSGCVR